MRCDEGNKHLIMLHSRMRGLKLNFTIIAKRFTCEKCEVENSFNYYSFCILIFTPLRFTNEFTQLAVYQLTAPHRLQFYSFSSALCELLRKSRMCHKKINLMHSDTCFHCQQCEDATQFMEFYLPIC